MKRRMVGGGVWLIKLKGTRFITGNESFIIVIPDRKESKHESYPVQHEPSSQKGFSRNKKTDKIFKLVVCQFVFFFFVNKFGNLLYIILYFKPKFILFIVVFIEMKYSILKMK